MLRTCAARPLPRPPCPFPRRLGEVVLLALLLHGMAAAGAIPGHLELDRGPEEALTLRLTGLPPAAERSQTTGWHWRWALDGSWTPVESRVLESDRLDLTAPARALALEVWTEVEAETGPWRTRRVELLADPRPRAMRIDAAPDDPPGRTAKVPTADAELRGTLVVADRVFDLGGYTGELRDMPLRHTRIELRRANDDLLLAGGATDADGAFVLAYPAAAAADVKLSAFAQIQGLPGLSLEVRTDGSASDALRLDVVEVLGLTPGSPLDLGRFRLPDPGGSARVQAFHLLDLALSGAEMLAGSDFLGQWPAAGSMPPVYWGPNQVHSPTRFESGAIYVSSPGSGDSDGWSDGLVLAVLGQWALATLGPVQSFEPPDFDDGERSAREALDLGSAWTFAALVRAWRGQNLRDADGMLLESDVSVLVDLPTAPPPGFPAAAEAGVDLERRVFADGESLAVRGQLGVWNVAAMGWDLADGATALDGDAVDDDGLEGDGSEWFAMLTQLALPARSGSDLAFEDLVEDWRATVGGSAALDIVVVDEGGCALFDDAAEPDGTRTEASALSPWRQPALASAGKVVLNEFFLGDRDGVELFNQSDATIDLGAWSVEVRRNGFGSGSSRTTTLGAGTLLRPGRSLVLREGAGADSEFERFDSLWSVPWAPNEDGSCTLRDDGGGAIDFVRWDGDGGADPSTSPVPAPLSFTGQLIAPATATSSLARGALGTDTDAASDFSSRAPTPRLPNLDTLSLRTLRPASDLDLFVTDTGSLAIVEVHAIARRDDARPRWQVLDRNDAILAAADPLTAPARGAYLVWADAPSDNLVWRLGQDPGAETSAAVDVGMWIPADERGRLPVVALRAVARNEDALLDTVDVTWQAQGSYEALEVLVDSQPIQLLAGDARSTQVVLTSGRHRIAVRPVLSGIAGPARETGVFVGATACEIVEGFENGGSMLFLREGFVVAAESYQGTGSLHDAAPGLDYPLSDEATAMLQIPVDLTTDSRLEFWHAAHLVPDGDRAVVELSLDDAVSWFELRSWDGNDQPGGSPTDPDWLDGQLTPEDWVREQIDLGPWAGERARLRFRRVSNESGSSIGWWVDAVSFGTPPGPEVWVTADGSDVFGCGHPERPLASIATALGQLEAGSSLRLGAGSFGGTLSVMRDGASIDATLPVPRGVHVSGAGSAQTIVQVEEGVRGLVVLDGTGGVPLVEGLTLRGGDIALDVAMDSLRISEVVVEEATVSVVVDGGRLELTDSVLRKGNTGVVLSGGTAILRQCTVDLFSTGVIVTPLADSLVVDRSLITRGSSALIQVIAPGPAIALSCSGFWGSPQAFLGVPPAAFDRTLFADPLYCGPTTDILTLASASPFLDLFDCGRVGARAQGCALPVVAAPPSSVARGELAPAFPNPFNPRTQLRFAVPRSGPVRLTIYDARGRLVRTLVDGRREAGTHEVVWAGRDERGRSVASGSYRVVLRSAGEVHTQAIALIR